MRPAVDPTVPPLKTTLRRADGEVRTTGQEVVEPAWIQFDHTRPLLVGVLPHAQCPPRVKGCGFCTFPHDDYDKQTLVECANWVDMQIHCFFDEHPELGGRRVDSLYFGGATANLTPRDQLSMLARTLGEYLDTTAAEVTLEGLPSLFLSRRTASLTTLLEIPARHHRISMGIQTFDTAMLDRMGRDRLGTRRDIEQLVTVAHQHGCTVSGDLLVNLPAQPRSRILVDVEQAVALGLDQICVYHLVLRPGQGTPWSEQPEMIAALPDLPTACDNWLAVRETLLGHGYVQTTLTNFERADVHASDRRFVYEEHGFTPDRYDALGFGPLAITAFGDWPRRRAIKLLRQKSPSEGLWGSDNLYFAYGEEDLRLLYLTRTLARLEVPLQTYHDLFGAGLDTHFGDAVHTVVAEGLATLDARALRLTPRGMFYADSVVGLLAELRIETLKSRGAGRTTRDLLEQPMIVLNHMG